MAWGHAPAWTAVPSHCREIECRESQLGAPTYHVHDAMGMQMAEGLGHLPRNPAAVLPPAKYALAMVPPQPQHTVQVTACVPSGGQAVLRLRHGGSDGTPLLPPRPSAAQRTLTQLHDDQPCGPIQRDAVECNLLRAGHRGTQTGQTGDGRHRQAQRSAAPRPMLPPQAPAAALTMCGCCRMLISWRTSVTNDSCASTPRPKSISLTATCPPLYTARMTRPLRVGGRAGAGEVR